MVAAFRDPRTGAITTGPTHACCWPPDACELCDMDPDSFFDSEGFLCGDKFLTREEAYALVGVTQSEQIQPAPAHVGTQPDSCLSDLCRGI
jgi:hypothetical protein